MNELISQTIEIFGPATVFLLIFMVYYLRLNQAISFGQFIFPAFWPEIVFRFRDYTRKKKSKLKYLYNMFWFSVISLVFGIFSELLSDIKEIPIPVLVFVFLIVFLFLPMILYMLYLSSKEKYY